MKKCFLFVTLALPAVLQAQQLVLKNDRVQRVLESDGKAWRTVRFADAQGGRSLEVKSDELNILPLNTNRTYSIADFMVTGKPAVFSRNDTAFIVVSYKPVDAVKNAEAVPQALEIKYILAKADTYTRKVITLSYNGPATVDRLEVERFTTAKTAQGGGRGEPVFIGGEWFFGLEYPAGYSRHTNGNTPKDYSRHYEKVGNYSFIDLEGRDIEADEQKGLTRLMHFPGFAKPEGAAFQIVSKTAVAGMAGAGQAVETAFMQYLAACWKAPRSFLHFNNWFEPQAKDLSGDGLVNIWRQFKTAITPYGVKMDAMVADDGWQNRKSIWDPSPKFFPNGYADVKKLSDKLKAEGVGFGLWLSINGYTNNIPWGVENGYREAKRNPYFSQYGRNYSVSATKYKEEVLKKIPAIAQQSGANYYKHDFNVLSDMGEGNNHPATDRHGHEATLDATLEILVATRQLNPEIHQNLTNWIWFSPWWLVYADYLWMLAGDDGTNGNWPEISTRAMASTDRDTYIWRMFGNPADRPLVPVSRLMTHGIIKNSRGMMESKEDDLQDWADYVLMHYGRGTLLKEWYVSPGVMKADDWKALCRVDGWAAAHLAALTNTVYVGGRPDEGHAYGYIGWEGERGVLVCRNTQAAPQQLVVPFDQSVYFKGQPGQVYHANVVYPYQDAWPAAFTAGKNMVITLPGYATMAFEIKKGKPGRAAVAPATIKFSDKGASGTILTVPENVKGRCDLLVTGLPDVPEIKVNGAVVKARRTSAAQLNNFAGYAKSGMHSDKAKPWNMQAFDLLPYAGKRVEISYGKAAGFEVHLLAEQQVKAPAAKEGNNMLWTPTQDTRRQTLRIR